MSKSAGLLLASAAEAEGESGEFGEVDSGVGSVQRRKASKLRMGLVLVLSLLSALLFVLAPLSLSLPFAVVALLAPLLTGCDCRHSRTAASGSVSGSSAGGSTSSRSSGSGSATDNGAVVSRQSASMDERQPAAAAAAVTFAESVLAPSNESATTQFSERQHAGRPQVALQVKTEQQQHQAHIAATHDFTGLAEAGSLNRHSGTKVEGDVSSSLNGHTGTALSMVRSEERMSVRKERVLTSRLVVRKVVSTEIVILSVPVRRERLEVETVYVEEPLVLPLTSDDETATKGYVRPLPPLPTDDTTAAAASSAAASFEPSSGDRYNYVGLDEAGQEVIELLLCEERPRIEMDVAAVTRVIVTRVPFPSSQLVEMDLLKERLEYIAPAPSASRPNGLTQLT